VLVVFAFIVLVLASARVTRLITTDKISFPIRQKLAVKLGPQHWFVYLVHCHFCTSVWTSLAFSAYGIALLTLHANLWWWAVPAALAMSHLIAPILWKFEGD
jgi:hypothetical protein